MSMGLKSSGKIDAWVASMKRMNVYDMGVAGTRQLVLFSTIYGRPEESQVLPHVRAFMMEDALTPVAMLRPTDALRKVLELVDDEAVNLYMAAGTQYPDAARSLGVSNTPMYLISQGLPMLRARFARLKFAVADSAADVTSMGRVGASADEVMGMYDQSADTLYLFEQSLGRMDAIADEFVFVLLHELAHVIDPCAEEQTIVGRQGGRPSTDTLRVITHCTRFRYILLGLCNAAGLIRQAIYRAARAALARDTTFSGMSYAEVDSWESSFTKAAPATSEFRLRSEVVSIPRARFIRGLARRNYADGAVMDLDNVVAVDGAYNLFDTDPAEYPLDVLNLYSAEGVVSDRPVPVSGSEYGLYMQFLPEQGGFVYIYTTPRGDVFTLNFAEAYWMLT
jgi:hypothetical protein